MAAKITPLRYLAAQIISGWGFLKYLFIYLVIEYMGTPDRAAIVW